MRRGLRLIMLAVGLGLAVSPVSGAAQGARVELEQEAARPDVVRSPILTIEIDRLYAESAYGQRVSESLEAEGAEITAQNRVIEADLIAEEKSLTETRAKVSPSEFRALADAFDEKVQNLRREQDAKARALGAQSDEHRRQFLALAEPVLAGLMQDAGAAVILDKRQVFLSAGVIDVTDTAIARIDQLIGDGAEALDDQGSDAAPDASPNAPAQVPPATGTIAPGALQPALPDPATAQD